MKANKKVVAALALTLAAGALPLQVGAQTTDTPERQVPGYSDTPRIPGTDWHVHDPNRPQPPMVEAGGAIATPPPGDAIVLFNGENLDEWQGPGGAPAHWTLADGAMTTPAPDAAARGSISTREAFGDIQLHLEFMTPDPDEGTGQRRGNSGVFLMGRYEVQVLNSWDNPVYPDGQASALYGQRPPLVNASAPTGEWQSYDIVFEAPRFAEDGSLLSPAYVTVFHNGILTQHRTPFQGGTVHRDVATYKPHAPSAPITLQDHGQKVAYRNIWVRNLDLPAPQLVPQMRR